MAPSIKRLRRLERECKASLASIDRRLGELMSLQVSREEQLAEIYSQLAEQGEPIEPGKGLR